MENSDDETTSHTQSSGSIQNGKSFRKIVCANWDDFIRKIREERTSHEGIIYRGHANMDWTLSTAYDRVLNQMESRPWAKGTSLTEPLMEPLETEIMGEFVNLFQDAALGLPELKDTKNRLEIAIHGRHHNLITPLLDWTFSPYIAAHFAYQDALAHANEGISLPDTYLRVPHNDIVIWGLKDPGAIEKNYEKEFQFVRQRRDTFYRQKAQRGVFTYLKNPEYRDLMAFLQDQSEEANLHCYTLPGRDCMQALYDLETMNISSATLFPDMEGAAAQANRQAYQTIFQRALNRAAKSKNR